MKNKTIGCRTKDGIAISLIDTISLLCEQLGKLGEKRLSSKPVKMAIRDLQGNETAYYAISKLHKTKQEEAREIFTHAVVKNMTFAERKRVSEILNTLD